MKIKLFLTDLDGTLTDGTYEVFASSNDMSKRFHTRDFHGMSLLYQNGIEVGVVTAAKSNLTEKHFSRSAPFVKVFTSVDNKLDLIFNHYVKSGIFSWEDIAYIGDDVMDLPLLSMVGLAAYPDDADDRVIESMQQMQKGNVFRSSQGGHGSVRTFINYILYKYNV